MSYQDDEIESTLLVNKQCYVYKIPPRHTSSGFRAAEWDLGTPIWTGKLVVASKGDNCFVRLEDPKTGELFAICPVTDTAVEPVSDSSRYFVLRIDDGRGRHAFIGMGFSERSEAFDFSAALQDHKKSKKESEEASKKAATQPKVDYSLKDGQTIHVELKTKKPSSSTSSNNSSGLLPPPPGGKVAHNIAPPPSSRQQTTNQNQGGLFFQTQPSQSTNNNDLWGDFTSFSSPSQQQTSNKSSSQFPSDWVAFQ